MKIIKDIKLKIDEEEALRYQGHLLNRGGKNDEIILQTTREEIEEGYYLFEPKGIYSEVMIRRIGSEGRITLENDLYLEISHSMLNLLKKADYLVLAVVTIGSFLENKVSEYFSQREHLRALALDAVGTVAVKSLSDHIKNLVCQEIRKRGFQTTRYFSPGFGDWDISQQKNIFKIIPAHKIGVKLTDSCMMVPQKSLSWMTGIGSNIIVPYYKDESHSCKTCQAVNCQFRKTFC